MKKCIVCMVQNSRQYLGVFIEYHSNLVDHIYFIDHRSELNLSSLSHPKVTVVRSNQVAQFQSECTNLVIQYFNLWKEYDWVFVIDIDEFLPFTQLKNIDDFLFKNRKSSAIAFNWLNGVAMYPSDSKSKIKTLGECDSITFHKYVNPNVKICANSQVLGNNFLFNTGAHRLSVIKSKFFSKIFYRKKGGIYNPIISEIPLYHVVSFDKESFLTKIQNYIRQIEMRAHVKGQGGWIVKEYPDILSDEEWLWYVANFRIQDKKLHFLAKVNDFHQIKLFEHLDKEKIKLLESKLSKLPTASNPQATKSEIEYLRSKLDDESILNNIKWFYIENLEIKIRNQLN